MRLISTGKRWVRFIVFTLLATQVGADAWGQTALSEEQFPSRIAALTRAENAAASIRNLSFGAALDSAAIAQSMKQLSEALAFACSASRPSLKGHTAAPSGPVGPSDARPSTQDLANRERATMQTHRPAGPIGSAPNHASGESPEDSREACVQVMAARQAVQAFLDRGELPSSTVLTRLDEAIAKLSTTLK